VKPVERMAFLSDEAAIETEKSAKIRYIRVIRVPYKFVKSCVKPSELLGDLETWRLGVKGELR